MATYSIDPHTNPLGEKHAAHLLRRTTFGPNINQIKEFADETPAQAFNKLTEPIEPPAPPIDVQTGSPWTKPPAQYKAGDGNSENATLFDYYKSWHLELMRTDGTHLQERMTWFLHSHMPTSIEVVQSNEAVYYQNALYRYYALGNFKTLFKKMCVDNAMLRYLDGETNSKDEPNENFAREMFELYSIGKGPQIAEGHYTNFTEDDIKAATRILTGFIYDDTFQNLDEASGIPTGQLRTSINGGTEVATRHDAGEKIFSSVYGNKMIKPSELISGLATKEAALQEFDDLIEMIFAKKETARFICRKIYRFFVYHEINQDVESQVIQPLADVFYNNDYELKPLLSALLQSKHFYDLDNQETTDNNIGALIKSPIELIIGALRFFNVQLPDPETQLKDLYKKAYKNNIFKQINQQGLNLYEPFEVAGYPAYHQLPGFNRNWITTTNLAYRYKFSEDLMNQFGEEEPAFRLDVVDWIENSGNISDPKDPAEIVMVFTKYLYPVEITQERYDYFLNTVFLEGLEPINWSGEWSLYKNSGDDSVVRQKLETLLAGIMQTPEYQIF